MIEVKEVKTRKQIKEFIELPLKMYKGNPYFVPPLYMDEKALFKKETVFDEQAESVYYLAYKDGKVVGRIHGILQRAANEKWGQKRIRFTRFDSIDDQEVADALFAAVEAWGKEKGMEEIVGPLGFSDLEREGLLIEGFDQLATFAEQYNYEYYQKLIENWGFEKEIDWVERQLRAPKVVDERLRTLSARMMEKYDLHYGTAKNGADFIKKYGDRVFEILDTTYDGIYQSVPINEKMKQNTLAGFKILVDVKYVSVILDKDDNIVCFGVALPSIAKAVQKSGGRLTPAGIVRILRAAKNPKVLELALIGVLPEYRHKGIATALIAAVLDMLSDGKIEFCETNLNLETNKNIQNQWKSFDAVLHKRRRSFVKPLNGKQEKGE